MLKNDLATQVFEKVAVVATDNRDLKRKIRAIRTLAQQALASGAESGAVAWRDALYRILEVSK